MEGKGADKIIVKLSLKKLALLLLAEFLAMYLLFMAVSYYAQAGILAKYVLEDYCVYMNTEEAKKLARAYNVSCVTVLINEDHVRYVLPNGKVIDKACGKECDNMSYVAFTFCKDGKKGVLLKLNK